MSLKIDGRAARWEGHRDRRRAELVVAAVRTIARCGPGATVDQIAEEAGVSRQVLYRQFTDRRDLDRAIVEHAASMLIEQLTPELAVDAGLEMRLRNAFTAYLDFIDAHLALYQFARASERDISSGSERRIKDAIFTAVTGTDRQSVDGPVRDVSPQVEMTAVAVVGITDAVVAAWLDDARGVTRPQLVDQLVTFSLGAILGPTSLGPTSLAPTSLATTSDLPPSDKDQRP